MENLDLYCYMIFDHIESKTHVKISLGVLLVIAKPPHLLYACWYIDMHDIYTL